MPNSGKNRPLRWIGWILPWLAVFWAAVACQALTGTDAPPVTAPFTSSPPTSAPLSAATSTLNPSPSHTEELPEPGFPPASATLPVPSDTPSQPPSVTDLPDPATATWRKVADGLDSPVGLAYPGDGSGRLFILEQAGVIRILQDGELLSSPFLDIRQIVGSQSNEQGLLGMAFHPGYQQNGYFYLNYTNRNGDTVIARFQVSPGDPNRADPDSRSRLLLIGQPFPNHNGGMVTFGPDGYLYLGLGDGGSANDPQGNGQSTNTLLGKILRLDVDGAEGSGVGYAIPPDNPFVNGGGLAEVWAYGLRNPWRFAFDRLTGDLYIGDVGQNAWEEIDFLPAGAPPGANFGWVYREGAHRHQGQPPARLQLVEPVAEYGREFGCAVTGGQVYRGAELPEWQGVYLYADFCSGIIWGLLRGPDGSWQNQLLYDTDLLITSFGEDETGEVYVLDRQGGVYHLSRP